MARRYLGGERPAPRPANEAALAATWSAALPGYQDAIEGCRLHEALTTFSELVGAANRMVDAEQPWVLAKAAGTGDAEASLRLRGVLGDLVEACRLLALAVAPFMPGTAPRVLHLLGYGFPFGADGNDGPPLLDELAWGRRASEAGSMGDPSPLFPRLDGEAPPG